MKKIFVSLLLLLSFNISFADVEDTSIIDELDKNTQDTIEEMNEDFSLKSFESCQDFEDVMWNYIKTYWENNKSRYGYPYIDWMYKSIDFVETDVMFDMEVEESAVANEVTWMGGWDTDDYSETNVQVEWVDESDIVKTDWKYIYYYNDEYDYVYIIEAWTLDIIKKIKLPTNFYSPVLYISDNRLVIVSSGYSNATYSWYRFYRNTKTYVIVYDTTDIENLVLSKLYLVDWNLSKSRLIWDYLYVISNTSFNIPYYTFAEDKDIDINVNNMIPKSIELTKNIEDTSKNLEVWWKKLPYSLKAWNVASCNEIEYVLPDEETLKKYDFSPSYNIISTINIKDSNEDVTKKIIAWSNTEIHMSLENLYLTSYLYRSYDFNCSRWSYCIVPWYPRGQNTLIHQISVDANDLEYQNSSIVPWTPLNQYSMDENDGKFRIITQSNYPELATNLYILNAEDLELHWMLGSIEPGEQFKSSRFIWDKLFLVTFERIDPLFVISMSDGQNPKILWELKIPWYSTYLHPYDENHLIWIWYDTVENKWWGTINSWVKIDLYEINYDKKCGDDDLTEEEKEKCDSWDYKWIIVKQKYTKTFGENWSYSEALNNPRMFMWKSSENKLFIPMQLYKNSEDDMYDRIDFYQWLFTIKIDKDDWISELSRLSHIDFSGLEKERTEECAKYSDVWEEKCVELIWGWEYCKPVEYNYVPEYCYADSPIWQYIASKAWQYNSSYIKRALWIGDDTYAISNEKISVGDGDDYEFEEFE